MLPEDELQELAADIKQNGLLEPIKTSQGQLIDGRNRLAACEIAGVEPRFEELDGRVEDLDSYIWSINGPRRHLTKSQKAVCWAIRNPETRQGKKTTSPLSGEVGREFLRMARMVLAVLPELAVLVRDGAVSLNEAHEKAQEQRKAGASAEIKLKELRAKSPDLAALVDEERMPLAEAWAAHSQRLENRASELRAAHRNLESVLTCFSTSTFWRKTSPSKPSTSV